MNKITLLTLTTLLLTSLPVYAGSEDSFPVTLEPEIKPKTFSVNLLYSDNFTYDNKTASGEFRGEVKTHFLQKGWGPVAEISYQFLSGYNPSIITGVIPWGSNAQTHDGSALLGYRIPIMENLGFLPYAKGRAIVTRGRGGDNLYGPEVGVGFEWKIYPETTHFNVRYGLMLPIIHRYTGGTDTVSSSTFLLSNLEARLSYRFLENWDLAVGFHMRQFPKYLGGSNLATNELLMWNGILFGVAFVF